MAAPYRLQCWVAMLLYCTAAFTTTTAFTLPKKTVKAYRESVNETTALRHRRHLSSVDMQVQSAELLKLKPSESAAANLGDQVAAAANAAIWSPMWPAEHHPDQNAVFGLALNYNLNDHYRFVGSLRRTGFKGDIVLATQAGISNDLKQFLKDNDVIVYALHVRCKSKLQCVIHKWFTDIEGTLPMAIIRHYLYLSWAQHYSPQSLIMVLDFRDTVFQSDPFAPFEEQIARGSSTELWFAEEHMPYKRIRNCVFNTGWLRDCWGKEVAQSIASHPVICSGSITGTRRGIEGFEKRLLEEVSRSRCHRFFVESDQGYTNLLYHTGELAKAGIVAQLDPRGAGPINTIGALAGKRHGYPIGNFIINAMRDEEGYIINCPKQVTPAMLSCTPEAQPGCPCLRDKDAGTNFAGCNDYSRSPVVHQYDRHMQLLGGFIDSKLSCRKDCMA